MKGTEFAISLLHQHKITILTEAHKMRCTKLVFSDQDDDDSC